MMGVYHITLCRGLKEICLYFDAECNFSCHGCITRYHPLDVHLVSEEVHKRGRTLRSEEVLDLLENLPFERVVFMGSEPTQDPDFPLLAVELKESLGVYNILLTNGWEIAEDIPLDEVCVSIKAASDHLFRDFTGMENPGRVLENFKRYYQTPRLRLRAESVLIPGHIDEREIERIARLIAEVDPSIPYRIDAYIPHKGDKFRRPTEEEMERARLKAREYLMNVSTLTSRVSIKHKVERIY